MDELVSEFLRCARAARFKEARVLTEGELDGLLPTLPEKDANEFLRDVSRACDPHLFWRRHRRGIKGLERRDCKTATRCAELARVLRIRQQLEIFSKYAEKQLEPFLNSLTRAKLTATVVGAKISDPIGSWTVEKLVVVQQISYLTKFSNFPKRVLKW